jgi:hypothetical protein
LSQGILAKLLADVTMTSDKTIEKAPEPRVDPRGRQVSQGDGINLGAAKTWNQPKATGTAADTMAKGMVCMSFTAFFAACNKKNKVI